MASQTGQGTLDIQEMAEPSIKTVRKTIPLKDISIDPSVYPREETDSKRVERFAALMRDGVEFPPIEVEKWPEGKTPYRYLDGAHRGKAAKEVDAETTEAILVELDGVDPVLYAARKAIGPGALKEKELEEVSQRAYLRNPKLSARLIGEWLGIPRSTADGYIAPLRAKVELELDLKIMRMHRLGIPQERIGERLTLDQSAIARHLCDLPNLANSINADLARGFTVPQVAEKYDWPEPLVWSVKLEDKTDAERFNELKWKIRAYDLWNWADVDKRFGDDWPGRIPAQLVAHVLYFFTQQGDLVFDPMAGGGVTPDTCLALNRRCWAFDLDDRPESRPEIEPHHWNLGDLKWPVNGKSKPDLIFFDPPYFRKKDEDYAEGSISSLSRMDYLNMLGDFFKLAKENIKTSARMAFLNADWRDFQQKSALEEDPGNAITVLDYAALLEQAGWQITHIVDAPLSSERFKGNMITGMQAKRTLGVVRRTLLMARRSK